MAIGNITSANATLVLTVEDLFPAGVELTQFSTDRIFETDEHEFAQGRMGVDGHMAAGFVPNPWNVTINLEASSPSQRVMEQISAAMATNRRTYDVSLTVSLPSLQKVITFSDGFLRSGKDVPGASKVLDPTTWGFTFGRREETGTN